MEARLTWNLTWMCTCCLGMPGHAWAAPQPEPDQAHSGLLRSCFLARFTWTWGAQIFPSQVLHFGKIYRDLGGLKFGPLKSCAPARFTWTWGAQIFPSQVLHFGKIYRDLGGPKFGPLEFLPQHQALLICPHY